MSTLTDTIQCPICRGTKFRHHRRDDETTCQECRGVGRIDTPLAVGTLTRDCSYCRGTGEYHGGTCILCLGKKQVPVYSLQMERDDYRFLEQAIIARRILIDDDASVEASVTPAMVQDALFEHLESRFNDLVDGAGYDCIDALGFRRAVDRAVEKGGAR